MFSNKPELLKFESTFVFEIYSISLSIIIILILNLQSSKYEKRHDLAVSLISFSDEFNLSIIINISSYSNFFFFCQPKIVKIYLIIKSLLEFCKILIKYLMDLSVNSYYLLEIQENMRK